MNVHSGDQSGEGQNTDQVGTPDHKPLQQAQPSPLEDSTDQKHNDQDVANNQAPA